MIISVYGGPESQEVDQRWSVDWKGELIQTPNSTFKIRTSNLDLNDFERRISTFKMPISTWTIWNQISNLTIRSI